MQVITIEDQDFSALLSALRQGMTIGKYMRGDGQVHVVYAVKRFMLVSTEHDQVKIALKPSHNLTESIEMALEFLHREQERGSTVEMSAGY